MSHDKIVSNERPASNIRLKVASLGIALLFLVTGFVMPVGAQTSPPDDFPFDAAAGVDYLLDASLCENPPSPPDENPWTLAKFAACSATNAYGDLPADELIHQYGIMQNPVLDPGFELANAGGATAWTHEDYTGQTGTITFDNGQAEVEYAKLTQTLGSHSGQTPGASIGPHFGFDAVSLDASALDGMSGEFKLILFTTVDRTTESDVPAADVYRFSSPVTPVGAEERFRFEPSDFQLTLNGADTSAPADYAAGSAAQLTYIQIQAQNVGAGVAFDNVLIDGTCVGEDPHVCAEYDAQSTGLNIGGPSPVDGELQNIFEELNYGDQEFHDGYGVMIVPYAAATGSDEQSLDITFWVGAVRYTASGPEWVDSSEFSQGIFLTAGASGEAGGSSEASTDGTVPLGSGAVGDVYLTAYQHLGLVGDPAGFTFETNYAAESPANLWLGAELTWADDSFHYYDFNADFEVDDAPGIFGFFNEQKLENPSLTVSDPSDVVPTPAPGASFLALAAAGGLLGVIDDVIAMTGCDGICDFNDGWFHIIDPQNTALVPDTGATTEDQTQLYMVPNADNQLVFQQEVWYKNSGDGFYDRLKLDGNQNIVGNTLVLFGPEQLTDAPPGTPPGDVIDFSDGVNLAQHEGNGVTKTASNNGRTITWAVDVPLLHDLGILPGDVTPLSHDTLLISGVYSKVWYVPGPGGAGPSEGRTDHPGDDADACMTNKGPQAACPASAGFYSLAKNLLLDQARDNGFDGNTEYRGGDGAFIDMNEYDATPVLASLFGDFDYYMLVDIHETGVYPDCSDLGCVPGYIGGLVEHEGPPGTYGRMVLDDAADDRIVVSAMPYNNLGQPLSAEASPGIGEDNVEICLVTGVFNVGDEIIFSAANPATEGDARYECKVTSDFAAYGDDGAYYTQWTRAELDAIALEAGVERGSDFTFYVFAQIQHEGEGGPYGWEKRYAHAQDEYVLANALNLIASPLTYEVRGFDVAVTVDEDPAPPHDGEDTGSILVQPANAVGVEFQIQNNGLNSDTFTYAFTTSAGSEISHTGVDGTTPLLAPSEVHTMTVDVDLADPGTLDHVSDLILTATSDTDLSQSGFATLTVSRDGDGDAIGDIPDLCPSAFSDGTDENPSFGKGAKYTATDNGVNEDTDGDGLGDECDTVDDRTFAYNAVTFQQGIIGNDGLGADTGGLSPWALPVWPLAVDEHHPDTSPNGDGSAWFIGMVFEETVTFADGHVNPENTTDSYFLDLTPGTPDERAVEAAGQATHIGTGNTVSVPLSGVTTGLETSNDLRTDMVSLTSEIPPAGEGERSDRIRGVGGELYNTWYGTAATNEFILTHPGEFNLAGQATITDPVGTTHNVADVYDIFAQAFAGESPLPQAPETRVLNLPGSTDADNDGYSNTVELRNGASPTNSHSTPYTDDDNDGIPNYKDSVGFAGSSNGGECSATGIALGRDDADPASCYTGDSGQLLPLEYARDLENWLGQEVFRDLTPGGGSFSNNAEISVRQSYDDGGEFQGFWIELRGAGIVAGIDNNWGLCITDSTSGSSEFGCPPNAVTEPKDGMLVNVQADSGANCREWFVGDTAYSNTGTCVWDDGRVGYLLLADNVPTGPVFIHMNTERGSGTGPGAADDNRAYTTYVFA